MTLTHEPRKVFGLSINETIAWYTAHVSRDGILDKPKPAGGILSEMPPDTDHTQPLRVVVDRILQSGLTKTFRETPGLFNGIRGIGISTIGVVDSDRNVVEAISRKHWTGTIDFNALFLSQNNSLFKDNPISGAQIKVQNDTSARALAEYFYGMRDRPERLFYIAADEGVNAATVIKGELVNGSGNSEVAHWMPQLHPDDIDFNAAELSGCRFHTRCYEGLCSRHRFRKEWGGSREKELWQLPAGKLRSNRGRDIDPREVFTFYMSQMAYTAALSFNPTRIVFGGRFFWGTHEEELLKTTKLEFKKWNRGYIPRFDNTEYIGALIQKTALNDSVKKYAALVVAQAAAYADHPERL